MQLYKLIPHHLLSQHSPLIRLLRGQFCPETPLRLGQLSQVILLGQHSRVLHPPRGLPCPVILLLGQPRRVLHLPRGQPHQVLRLPLPLGQPSPVLLLGQPRRVLHLPRVQPHQVLRLLKVMKEEKRMKVCGFVSAATLFVGLRQKTSLKIITSPIM